MKQMNYHARHFNLVHRDILSVFGGLRTTSCGTLRRAIGDDEMEIRQLRSFRAIVATGSFGVAAEQLSLTQSALSHQIRQLEEELGTTLLVRARPHVYLTEAGHVLLSAADRILAELNDVRQQFGLEAEGEHVEVVRVAATTVGFAYIYGDLCHAFIARNPSAKLDFTATETPEGAVSKVLMRAADIAFTPLPVDFPTLDILVLGEVEHVFIVGKAHELVKSRTVAMREIQRFPFVRYHRGSGSRMVSDAVFASHGGYPAILTESNDTGFVKRIVGIGLGIALVPVFALADELRSGSLHAFRLPNQKIMDQFGLVMHKGHSQKVLEKFVNVCLECRGSKPKKLTLETLDKLTFYRPRAAGSC
jgi:DNA-binding transcriptional LysR family regulator